MERANSLYSDVNKNSGSLRLTTIKRSLAFNSTYVSFRYKLFQLRCLAEPYSITHAMSLEQAVFVSVMKLTCCSCDKHPFPMFFKTSSVQLEVNCCLCFSTDVLFHYSRTRNLKFAYKVQQMFFDGFCVRLQTSIV